MYSIPSFELLLLLLGTFVSSRVLERSPALADGLLARGIEGRDVCVQDDWLIGFKAMQVDSYPFCSSLLGIGTLTGTSIVETVGSTEYLTVTTTTTDGTLNIPSATATVTTTVKILPVKRDAYPEAQPVPMVALPQQMMLFQEATSVVDQGSTNTTILNTIYSACSCLHISPRGAIAPATATTTRVQTVIYRSQATQTNFNGISTLTVYESDTNIPSPSVTAPPLPSGPSVGLPSPSDGNATALTTPTPALTIETGTLGNPILGANGTVPGESTLPASGTLPPASLPSSGASGLPSLSASETLPSASLPLNGSSVLPTVPASETLPPASVSPTGESGLPSLPASETFPPVSLPSNGSTGLPTLPASEPFPSASLPSTASAGLPLPSSNGTSSVPGTSPTNGLVPPPSTGPPLAGVCPEQDGDIITESDGEQFQILCYTEFPNMPTAGLPTGLDVPTFSACVQGCQISNDGFSAYRCRGVTYIEGQLGINCFFKNAQAVTEPRYDINNGKVSAILLNPNNTFPVPPEQSLTPSGATSLGLSNSTGLPGPTAIPTAPLNLTSVPVATELPTGPTGSPSSGLPALSANGTSDLGPTSIAPTDVPTGSGNFTPSAIPTGSLPSGIPSLNGNVTAPSGATDSSAPSGLPSITVNGTSGAEPTASVPSGFPSLNGNVTVPSGATGSAPSSLPSITANGTSGVAPTASLPSGIPSPSGNETTIVGPTASVPSGIPTLSSNETAVVGPTASVPSGFPSLNGNVTAPSGATDSSALSGLPSITANGTSGVGPTGSLPSGIPSVSGNFTLPVGPTGTAPALTLSSPANVTAVPSLTPTNSFNITSAPSLLPTFSGNDTNILPTGTGFFNSSSTFDPRSGGPLETANSTCLYVASSTVVITQTVRSTEIVRITRTSVATVASLI